jgi:uncharacterized membrane protein YeiH
VKGRLVIATLVGVAAVALTGSASAQSEQASCVGVYSSYYAHGGGGTHRSEVAQDFATNAQPAGRNVYSQVARWEDCP